MPPKSKKLNYNHLATNVEDLGMNEDYLKARLSKRTNITWQQLSDELNQSGNFVIIKKAMEEGFELESLFDQRQFLFQSLDSVTTLINGLLSLIIIKLGNPLNLDHNNLKAILGYTSINSFSSSALSFQQYLLKEENKARLLRLVTSFDKGGIGFTAENISSILHLLRAKAADVLAILCSDNVFNNLRKLTTPQDQGGIGFTAENISSILNRDRANVAESISSLCSDKTHDNLRKLITPLSQGGIGFLPKNISSILHRAGANAAKKIDLVLTKIKAFEDKILQEVLKNNDIKHLEDLQKRLELKIVGSSNSFFKTVIKYIKTKVTSDAVVLNVVINQNINSLQPAQSASNYVLPDLEIDLLEEFFNNLEKEAQKNNSLSMLTDEDDREELGGNDQPPEEDALPELNVDDVEKEQIGSSSSSSTTRKNASNSKRRKETTNNNNYEVGAAADDSSQMPEQQEELDEQEELDDLDDRQAEENTVDPNAKQPATRGVRNRREPNNTRPKPPVRSSYV